MLKLSYQNHNEASKQTNTMKPFIIFISKQTFLLFHVINDFTQRTPFKASQREK